MKDLMMNKEEARVLGSLIEKEMTTPDLYPLTLNALINACNQKTNRDPVVGYDEETVLQALDQLKGKDLVWESKLSRAIKYEERFTHNTQMVNKEAAVICVLLLRGPQTIGEIKSRTERMCNFSSLDDVTKTIESTALVDFVERLSRQPGQKESRYHHTMLLDAIEKETSHTDERERQNDLNPISVENERLENLEMKVEKIYNELNELRNAFIEFKNSLNN
ncbi:MAG: hypothetical protein OMM_01002 [Candidatus Magnetoglobus multicellularis str. Araruama]|uniref:Uncharacterized protein n=1 Tax=Candidatus Magnetoglobus multicellularis str. Araruama TaxID=890399 RepID=A0A1V1PF09_9BACT|nr:MAG: hypothetical protein OMM_01002 [Candidatus Magnetoglobus multicellularis str. Araruama]